MSSGNEIVVIKAEQVKEAAFKLTEALKIPGEDAALLIDCLVENDLRGVNTHGVRCLQRYAGDVESGLINRKPDIRIVKETPVSAVVDGDHGFGQVVSCHSMKIAIKKAKKAGVGIVSAYNSCHNGTSAYFTMMAIKEDLIGISCTGASPRIPPAGGKTAVIGNDPWSFAFPCAQGDVPVVIDMCNSVVSAGKVMETGNSGQKIPMNWLLDKDGNPTEDLKKFAMMQPFGGYKGFAVSIVSEVMSSVLAEKALMSTDIKTSAYNQTGHFFMALDPELFLPIEVFKKRIRRLAGLIKASELMPGIKEVFMPGEQSYMKFLENSKNGIPFLKEYADAFNNVLEQYNIPGI